MNWKKFLKAALLAIALGGGGHSAKDLTIGKGETSDLIIAVVTTGLAAAISTDSKDKKDDSSN